MNNLSLDHCLHNRERALSHLHRFTKSDTFQLAMLDVVGFFFACWLALGLVFYKNVK